MGVKLTAISAAAVLRALGAPLPWVSAFVAREGSGRPRRRVRWRDRTSSRTGRLKLARVRSKTMAGSLRLWLKRRLWAAGWKQVCGFWSPPAGARGSLYTLLGAARRAGIRWVPQE